jgi:hypothetical protein
MQAYNFLQEINENKYTYFCTVITPYFTDYVLNR